MTEPMTKAFLQLRCRQILSKVGRVSEPDELFLLTDVFPRHPDWAEKAGSGVRNVEVRRSGLYNSVGFWLLHSDGSSVDISYNVCLKGRGPVRANVIAAARSEILGQVGLWKLAHPAPMSDMHADHVVPFDHILKQWLDLVKLEIEEIAVISKAVGHQNLFASRDLALSWQRHHARAATYQWLSAADNVAKSNTLVSAGGLDAWLAEYDVASAKERRAG